MAEQMKHEIADVVRVGEQDIRTFAPPTGLRVLEAAGLLAHESVRAKVVHEARDPEGGLYETRATVTPAGDYLLLFPDGGHYAAGDAKINDMLAYRSADRGATWQGPTVTFDIDYNQHGFVPLIPRGSKRIYAFGTQPLRGRYTREHGLHENAPIGYRYSDDDGHTWSDVELIRPDNDPEFTGMSVMRMCETERGTWLIGSHEGDWSCKPLITRQYLLRSEDQGETWTLLPCPRPGGWQAHGFDRMDEGRPIALGGGEVLLMARTPEGHLWAARSEDDGKTWSDPAPTPLVHPDAPPMLFHLSDGKTLAAFHHNRHSDTHYTGLSAKAELMKDRSEVWVALSGDGGRTWDEPRFVFANALIESFDNAWRNHQCSYMDAFADDGVLHLFLPHRWERALHLTLEESALTRLPGKGEL